MGAKLDFDEIKKTVLVPMVLAQLGKFENFVAGTSNDNWRGPCPFNTVAKPDSRAFAIFEENLRWRCHDSACEGHPIDKKDAKEIKGGNVVALIMAYENISEVYKAGLRLMAIREKGTQVKTEAEKPKPEQPATSLETAEAEQEGRGEIEEITENPPLTAKMLETVKLDFKHEAVHALGFTPEYAESMGIGYKAKSMLKGRVAFPIHNLDGEIVAFGGINLEDENLWAFPPKFNEAHRQLEIAGYAEVRRRLAEGEYSEPIVNISFSLLEQAHMAQAHLSLAILSENVSAVQKAAITRLVEEFPEIIFLVRVTREKEQLIGTKAAVQLLPFLTPLTFTKSVTFI